jgi:hypothetical protein
MIPATAEKIEKEDLPKLQFPKEAVHLSQEHRRELDAKLDRAMKLGNTEQNKCRILFKDTEGLKYVETTVWSFDQGSIVLKYGHTIPLIRVLDVQFH